VGTTNCWWDQIALKSRFRGPDQNKLLECFSVYVEGQLTIANISAATEEAPYTEGFTSPQTSH
jgi:hypothetical protein